MLATLAATPSAHQTIEQRRQLGGRVGAQPAVDRAGLNDRAAGRAEPPEALAQPAQGGQAAPGDPAAYPAHRLEGVAHLLRVDTRGERGEPHLVDAVGGVEEVRT